MNDSTTPTSAPALDPLTPDEPQDFTVQQRMLNDAGETKMELPQGSMPMDVHLIDGRYYLRTLEPTFPTSDDTFEFSVFPVTVGSRVSVPGPHLVVLPVRHGGIHFLAYRRNG